MNALNNMKKYAGVFFILAGLTPLTLMAWEDIDTRLERQLGILNSCRQTCQSQNPDRTESQCDSSQCSQQKSQHDRLQQLKARGERQAKGYQTQNFKNILQGSENRLNSCRQTCQNQNPTYTKAQCDLQRCSSQKEEYDKLTANMPKYEQGIEDSEQGEQAEDSSDDEEEGQESAAKQIKNAEKKSKSAEMIGIATTAFMGVQTARSCGASPPDSMCPVYVAMTAASFAQWRMLKQQQRDMGNTREAIESGPCVGPDCENPGGTPTPPPVFPPSCHDDPAMQCERINEIGDPTPPGDEDEDRKDNTQGNGNPPPIGPGSYAGNAPGNIYDDFGNPNDPNNPNPYGWSNEELGNIYKPEGGWPDGKNPFANVDPDAYNKASAAQKKRFNQALAKLNSRNKGYMDQAGLGEGAGDGSGSGWGSGATEGTGSQAGAGAGSFAGDEGGGDSFSGEGGGASGGRSPNSKNMLAKQMQDLLKNYGRKDGGASPQKKSVRLGDDNIGVAEDNIFKMVHRRHRAMDKESYFIVDSLF